MIYERCFVNTTLHAYCPICNYRFNICSKCYLKYRYIDILENDFTNHLIDCLSCKRDKKIQEILK